MPLFNRFERVSLDPHVMGRVHCIKGTRIPIATVVSLIAEGQTSEEIVTDFPQLSTDDVSEALGFAAQVLRERELPTWQLHP